MPRLVPRWRFGLAVSAATVLTSGWHYRIGTIYGKRAATLERGSSASPICATNNHKVTLYIELLAGLPRRSLPAPFRHSRRGLWVYVQTLAHRDSHRLNSSTT